MSEADRISELERQVQQLQRQMVAMSELLSEQSNLIVKLSQQQTEGSRLLSLVNTALQEPAVVAAG